MNEQRTGPLGVSGVTEDAPPKSLGRDDLPPDGEGDEVVTQGMAMALENLVGELKRRRSAMGLSIADVARRSRLTPVTLSRLENRHNRNPSLDTVFRYAMALDALVTLGLEEIGPDEQG